MERFNGNMPIDYKTAYEQSHLYDELSPNEQIEFRAIDKAILAVNMDGKLVDAFNQKGINFDRVCAGVRTLEDLFVAVSVNVNQDLADDGHIKHWGRNIMKYTSDGFGNNGQDEVNKRLRQFALSEELFGIDLGDSLTNGNGVVSANSSELEFVR